MKILFYDTETTGLADFKSPFSSSHQPRLVQLYAVLVDGPSELAELYCLVCPEGFDIPKEATDVHGISTQRALDDGVSLVAALSMFMQMARLSNLRVGFNIDYDRLVMKGELWRLGKEAAAMTLDRDNYCVMKAITGHCRIPSPYGYQEFKWPNLEEACRHAFGEQERTGAHDARNDVRDTRRLYDWLMAKGKNDGDKTRQPDTGEGR